MLKLHSKKLALYLASILFLFTAVVLLGKNIVNVQAQNSLSSKLSGKILLQVEDNGEAWYLNPQDNKRSYLGRPHDAFNIMREEGIGITNDNLFKIPLSLDNLSGKDSDSDGLPDNFEIAIGTNPESSDTDSDGYDDYVEVLNNNSPRGDNAKHQTIDKSFAKSHQGKIFIQVEGNGEAWYVDTTENKRHYLGRPSDAFSIMRHLGLGITNTNLNQITIREGKGIQEYNYSEPKQEQQQGEENKEEYKNHITVTTHKPELMREFSNIIHVFATINDSSGYDFKEKGFLFDYTMNKDEVLTPTLAKHKEKLIDNTSGLSINAEIDNLLPKSYPYIRAYVITSEDVVYYEETEVLIMGNTETIDSIGAPGTPPMFGGGGGGGSVSRPDPEPVYYDLTYTASDGGYLATSTEGEINELSSFEKRVKEGNSGDIIYAISDTGYSFTSWSDGSTSNPRTDLNVTSDIDVTANFEIDTYTVNYISGDNGSITGSTTQIVNHGSSTTAVEAIPNTGYSFVDWSDGVTDNPRTDENVTTNINVIANFEIDTYTVNYISGDNGSITGSTTQIVNHGSSTTAVEAIPNTGYSFVDWSDGVTDNPRTDLNVTSDINVTANFEIDTYTVSYNSDTNGSVIGSTTQIVNHGSSTTAVEAIPNTGYSFVDWSDGVTDNPRTDENVTTNINVIANFEIDTYTVNYISGDNGSITGSTTQIVNHGSSTTAVEAIPNTGYSFVDWSDGVTDNPRTDENVTTNINVIANFEIDTYTVNYNSDVNGSITGSTTQIVNHGSSTTAVEAIPNTGYSFVDWSDGVTDNPRTDENVTTNINVIANFEIDTYTVNYISGDNGSITGSTTQIVNHGSSTTAVEAIPNTGYSFVDWSDGVTDNPRTDLNVTSDINVIANFEIDTYTVNYNSDVNGSITGSTTQIVNHGSSTTAVEAIPNTGYSFVDWSDGSTSNPRTDLNVTSDIDVTANFEIDTYTVNYISGDNGSITGSTTQIVNHGSSTTAVEAIPNTGYSFVDWSDGVTDNPRTDENVTTNINVIANFEIDTYTVNYISGDNGSITGSTTQIVNHGSSTTAVEAIPNTGYSFVDWSDGVTDNPRTDLNVTSDINVIANFEIDTYTVNYNSDVNGSITGSTTQIVNHGSSTTAVEAIPNTGYSFVDWSDGSTSNPRTDENVTTNINVIANFEIDTYTVNYISGDNGSITGSTTQIVNHGSSTTAVEAIPNTGYSFVDWSDGVTDNPRTDENVTTNINVIANFEIDTYTVNYNSDTNGSVIGSTTQIVNHGSSTTAVEAIPNTGYSFVDWSDGSTSNPRTDLNVTSDINVIANFEIDTYTVNYISGDNGSITGSTTQIVNHGSSTTAVEAIPNTGYSFVDWSDGVTDNPRTDENVTTNINVIANFEIDTYTVNYNSDVNGSITGSTTQIVNHGSSTTAVEAIPNTGYSFVDWSDGVTDNPRTDENVTTNINVIANFEIDTYTVNYISGDNGSITGSTTQIVNHGSSTTAVEAIPNTGYSFVDWSDGVTDNPRTDLNVTSDINVIANFEIDTYTVNYNSDVNGSITGSTTQIVNHGSSTTAVEAIPNTGYSFVDWSDGSTSNPRTDLNVTSDIDVTANFEIDTYTVNYISGDNGSITGSTTQIVNHGSSTTAVEAIPNTGYSFVDWSDGVTDNPRTDENVTTNINVIANFEIDTYTVNYISGDNGSITGSTTQIVNHGSSTTAVEAIPNTGYSFVDWSDGVTDNPRTDLNVTSDINVIANFEIDTYTVNYNSDVNGSITGSTTQIVNHGSSTTAVEAIPNTGYSFVDWSDGSTSNPRTDLNVTSDIDVTANFEIDTYTVNYISGDNGSITGSTTQIVNHGSSTTAVEAIPNTGYSFVDWSDGSTSNPRTDLNVTSDINVIANFEIDTYTVNYISGDNGSITGSTTQIVNHGSSTTAVEAIPNTNYHFVDWSDGSTSNPRTDENVTSDMSVTANFEINDYDIIFNANGGTGSMANQTITFNTSANLTNNSFTREGYNFTGWATTTDGVVAYSDGSSFTMNVEGITLYAQWTANNYDIIFNDNGGTGSMDNQTITFNTSANLTTNTFSREGYDFTGWNTESDGSGTSYTDEASFTMDVEGITLYAQWEMDCGDDVTFTYNGEVVTYGVVGNPDTGMCWLDRNLGATQVATALDDPLSYGDLFQWGRGDDGHQERTSNATSTLSSTDDPGHSNFITPLSSPFDWRSPQNDNLWQGETGINNPCPTGFRLPTIDELETEMNSWSSENSSGAFNSPLKWSVAGSRISNGSFSDVGSSGYIWSSSVSGSLSSRLHFRSSGAGIYSGYFLAYGYSVRCLRSNDNNSNDYDVVFDANGGTGTMDNQTITFNTSADLTANSYTRAGYNFTGWNTESNGSGTSYTDKASFTMNVEGITLYAQWEMDCGDDVTFTYNGSEVTYGVVGNPDTGMCWLDRNLGATQVATASDDSLSYGDLFQWGRGDDGHQERTSGETSTLSSGDVPGHSDFITSNSSPYEWRSPQNDNLWQGETGINNPCPTGFRLPTIDELTAERLSWSSNNSSGAFSSSLKWSVAGNRHNNSSLDNVGSNGSIWSSSVSGSNSFLLYFHSSGAGIGYNGRAGGFSVRCLRD